MKKNIITKILLGLLVVLLVFSVVACKPKTQPKDEPIKENPDVEPPANLATLDDIRTILDGFQNLATSIDAINDEIHFDITLALTYEMTKYTVRLQGNIFNEENFANNELAVIVKDVSSSSSIVTVLAAYLKDDVLYIDQTLTATPGRSKFSKLDGLELSKNLSALPGMIKDAEFNLVDALAGINDTIDGMESMINLLLGAADVLLFDETTDKYTLQIAAGGIAGLVDMAMTTFFKDGFGDMQGAVDFALKFFFGVDKISDLADADVANFPELKIEALRSGTTAVNGLNITYEGQLDDSTTAKEFVSFGFTAEIDNDENVAITWPTFTQFTESVLKASLTIDIGAKDFFLKADVFGNPDFTSVPTAYLVAEKANGDVIANLDAMYDGETLFFDLAGLYTTLGIALPENTMYSIDYKLFTPETTEVNSSEPLTTTETEGLDLPFEISPNFLVQLIGKIGTIFDLVKDTALTQTLDLNVNSLLSLVDGLLVKTGTTVKYAKADMIADLNDLLAPFASDEYKAANTTATKAQLAQSVIADFSGINISVADLINAGSTSQNNVHLSIGLLEDALGFELDLTKGTGTSAQAVLNVKFELDIVTFDSYDAADKPIKDDYTGAIDLDSVFDEDNNPVNYNIYFVVEGEGEDAVTVKKYVILDELLVLLDAYREYSAA